MQYGADVTLLDSLVPQFGGSYFNISPIRNQVHVNISDMRDANSLDVLVQGQDFIFNLAGQVSHGDSMRDPQLDLAVNCVSTMNLVEACRKHNPEVRMVYSSTRQVYGRPQKLPVTEDHPTVPIDVNGINKLAAEYYHLLYHTHLRHPLDRAAADQHLRPAAADSQQPARLCRHLHPAGAARREDQPVRRRRASARFQLCRRRRQRVAAGRRPRPSALAGFSTWARRNHIR